MKSNKKFGRKCESIKTFLIKRSKIPTRAALAVILQFCTLNIKLLFHESNSTNSLFTGTRNVRKGNFLPLNRASHIKGPQSASFFASQSLGYPPDLLIFHHLGIFIIFKSRVSSELQDCIIMYHQML